MTSPIVDFSEIDLTGSVKFEDQQISSVYYNGERLWPFGVDLLYTGGINGASYLPDIERAFSSFYADTPASYATSVGLLESTNDRDPLSYSDIFLAGNQGDAFVVAPAYCFTDLAGTIQAGEGDVVLAMRGVVKGTLITQSDPALQPVLEKDARGVWSLRCNGNKFLRSSELFTVAANFTATVAMSVLSLTGISGATHILGPVLAATTASLRVRASGTRGASTVGTALRIAGGALFAVDTSSAFQVGTPFVASGMHEGNTITARQGDLLSLSAAANAGSATAQATLQLGVSGGYDARIYGGVYINRALSQTERMRIEKRMKLDFSIRPDGAIASGQLSAALLPLLGRAPKRGRVNLMSASNNFALWTGGVNTTGPDANGFWSMPTNLGNLTRSVTNTNTTDFSLKTVSVLVKANPINGGKFFFINTNIGTTRVSTTFDTSNLSEGLGVELIADDVYRVSWVNNMNGWNGGTLSISPVSEAGKVLTFKNFEFVLTALPDSSYQTVDVLGVGITEEGVPSYPFLRFDMSDDRLDTVLPQAVTGDVVIAGRNGSITTSHSYAANSTFQLGPTSYTGGTPGILRAIGDVVGWSILNKTLTTAERERLMRFYKRRGAKGLLVPGPELVVNGGFDMDLSGWVTSAWVYQAGRAYLNTGTAFQAITQTAPMLVGKDYLIAYDYEVLSGQVQMVFNSQASPAPIHGVGNSSYTFAFRVSDSRASQFSIRNNAAVTEAYVNNVSIRELRPEEEW